MNFRFLYPEEFWQGEVRAYVRNLKHVRSFFGTDIKVIALLWSAIGQDAESLKLYPCHLLWVLHFLRVYPTASQAEEWAKVSFKTWTQAVWSVLSLIVSHVDSVLSQE
jgi:hypothetical protein